MRLACSSLIGFGPTQLRAAISGSALAMSKAFARTTGRRTPTRCATTRAPSIGAPGTPGVSIAILISVAAGFGIPVEGMVIILGVDRILDMARMTVNVTCDLVACLLLRNVSGTVPVPLPHHEAV